MHVKQQIVREALLQEVLGMCVVLVLLCREVVDQISPLPVVIHAVIHCLVAVPRNPDSLENPSC